MKKRLSLLPLVTLGLMACVGPGGHRDRVFEAGVLHPPTATVPLPDTLPVAVRVHGPLRVSALTVLEEAGQWYFTGRICSGGRSHIFRSDLELQLVPMATNGLALPPRKTRARLQAWTRRHHGKRCAPFRFPIPSPGELDRLELSRR